MKCLGKNVVLAVGEVKFDNKTEGGIFLPDKGNAEPRYDFTVALIGDEVKKVGVGDVVLKPEVTVLRSTRVRQGEPEFDLRLLDGRDAIVVDEDDIRLVLEEAHN